MKPVPLTEAEIAEPPHMWSQTHHEPTFRHGSLYNPLPPPTPQKLNISEENITRREDLFWFH